MRWYATLVLTFVICLVIIGGALYGSKPKTMRKKDGSLDIPKILKVSSAFAFILAVLVTALIHMKVE